MITLKTKELFNILSPSQFNSSKDACRVMGKLVGQPVSIVRMGMLTPDVRENIFQQNPTLKEAAREVSVWCKENECHASAEQGQEYFSTYLNKILEKYKLSEEIDLKSVAEMNYNAILECVVHQNSGK